MSCCKPGYREIVNEKEKEINEKGSNHLSPFVKVIAVIITIGAITTAVFLT